MAEAAKIVVATTAAELRAATEPWRRSGQQIALVPTMGALHDGHLAHVKVAAEHAQRVAVSIFVNPTQFAPNEDFSRYPRDFDSDVARLESLGKVDLIYAPETAEIYPDGFATKISVEGPALGLESDFRPHFFAGVATVVAKLFLHCRPHFATFGEKDYQQLLVVTRLAKDLDLGVEILPIPIVRDPDGLALSSRNAYLTNEQRQIAAQLNKVLREVAQRAKVGVSIPQAEAEGAAGLINAGFDRVDYVAVRDANTLAPLATLSGAARVLAAARIGTVRLIDNIAV